MTKRQSPKRAITRRVAMPDPPAGQGDGLAKDSPEPQTQNNGQGQDPPANPPPRSDLWPEAEEEARKKAELDARIADAVSRAVSEKVGELNRVLSSLPQVITEATKNEVKGQMDGVMEEIKLAILAGQQVATTQAQQLPPPAQVGQIQQPPQGGTMDQVLMILSTLMGGNKGNSGGLKDALAQVTEFQNMAAALWQNPYEAALRSITTVLKGGYSVGKSTEELVDGLEKTSPVDIFKIRAGGSGSKS